MKNRNRKPVTLSIPVLPELQAVLDERPAANLAFLFTEFGKPFTSNGFDNRFRKWCDEAGLPHVSAHGLRKAGADIAAENGATARAAARRARLDAMLEILPVIAFDDASADAHRAIVQACGYSRRKLLDRMIAAQALVHQATLVTLNAEDFQDIPGLALLAWQR